MRKVSLLLVVIMAIMVLMPAMFVSAEKRGADMSASASTIALDTLPAGVYVKEAQYILPASSVFDSSLPIGIPPRSGEAIEFSFSTYLKTRGGVNVPAYIASRDYTEEEKLTEINLISLNFPDVEILDDPTPRYNCHSYAWFSRSTSNPYWIDSPDVPLYLDDIHTNNIEAREDVRIGDIVVYKDHNGVCVHSAVVVEIDGEDIYCVSKWGRSVLCRHHIEYVPSDYLYWGFILNCDFYRVTSHNNMLSYNASTHTYSCRECPYTVTEPHRQSPLGVCPTCGYSGPIAAASVGNTTE